MSRTDLGLEEYDGVGVTYGREEQAFRLYWGARQYNLWGTSATRRREKDMCVTLMPAAPRKKPSGLCEWYKPPCPTAIVGERMVRPPTLYCPPER